MKRILLVRHGESEWNAARRLQGQADIDLSERGRAQAVELRATIAALNPDVVVASDLKRASDTAGLLGHPDALRTDKLREMGVGDWTGKPIVDLAALPDGSYNGWRAGTFTPPGGETWDAFSDRVTQAVSGALGKGAERLLVVSHGGVIRALLQRLIGLPPHRMVPVGPASLSIVAVRGQADMRLELLNFSPAGPVLDAPD